MRAVAYQASKSRANSGVASKYLFLLKNDWSASMGRVTGAEPDVSLYVNK